MSGKIFEGLADSACSILHFTDDIINGENKEARPRWEGIGTLIDYFEAMKVNIRRLRSTGDKYYDITDITTKIGQIENKEKQYNDGTEGVVKDVNCGSESASINGQTYNTDTSGCLSAKSEAGSFNIHSLNQNPRDKLTETHVTLSALLDESTPVKIEDKIELAKMDMVPLNKTLNDISDSIDDPITFFFPIIDEYGSLAFKITFSVIFVINLVVAAFLVLRVLLNCLCLGTIFKLFVTIFWNVLALLMILSFIIGSIFCVIGSLGKDLISVVSIALGTDNLSTSNTNSFLIKDNTAKGIFEECVNKDGDLENPLGLNNNPMTQALSQVCEKLRALKALNIPKETVLQGYFVKVNDVTTGEYKVSKDGNVIKFRDLLDSLNNECTEAVFKYYESECPSGTTICRETDYSTGYCSGSNLCYPLEKWDPGSTSPTFSSGTCSDKWNDMKSFRSSHKSYIEYLKGSSSNYKKAIDTFTVHNPPPSVPGSTSLTEHEDDILLKEKTSLELIESSFGGCSESGKTYEFINCKFISTYVKLILKALNNGMGSSFKGVGTALCLTGCSIAVFIVAVLLIMAIMNEIEKKKKEENDIKEIKVHDIYNSDRHFLQ